MTTTGNGVRLSLNGHRQVANPIELRILRLEKLVAELLKSQAQHFQGGRNGPDGQFEESSRRTDVREPGAQSRHPASSQYRKEAEGNAGQGSSQKAPEGQAKEQVALAGEDGERAEDLLAEAKLQGAKTLSSLLGRALRRHLEHGHDIVGPLFDEHEMEELAKALEATTATAELLGRARIRERQKEENDYAERVRSRNGSGIVDRVFPGSNSRNGLHGVENFAFDSVSVNALTPLVRPFHSFVEEPMIRPFPPARALAYFKRLVPSLDVHPERFGAEAARRAFTLAGNTSLVLRERVQKAVADTIAEGDVPKGEGLVRMLLEKTGCSRKNPQYSEMVFRTNMMDSFQVGAQEELRHPDVIEDFPAWQWVGIRDGRQRHSHEVHFDKYFPSSVTFQQVRDRNGYDGYNDRCNFRPVHKTEWRRLQGQGVTFSLFAEQFASFWEKGQCDKRLYRAGEKLAKSKDPAPMPGYGQIFVNDSDVGGHKAEVWYVGGDGDEKGFGDLMKKVIREAFPAVDKIIYEAETFPPRGDPNWRKVYPNKKDRHEEFTAKMKAHEAKKFAEQLEASYWIEEQRRGR